MTEQTSTPVPTLPMGIDEIKKILPHRYPFLLVDKIIQLEMNKSITGIKNLTVNEPFFQGHFPDYPVMPGVLQIEALAQTGAVMALLMPENYGKGALLSGVDGFKFRRQVRPGDVLKLELELMRYRSGFGKCHAIASVDGTISCEGEINFATAKF